MFKPEIYLDNNNNKLAKFSVFRQRTYRQTMESHILSDEQFRNRKF